MVEAAPLATLGGFRDTIMRARDPLKKPFITVEIPGSYYRSGIMVQSFRATFIFGVDSLVTTSSSNQFTPRQVEIVQEQNADFKIYFDKIRATGRDGRMRNLSPFWIRVE